jgi:hypothetical protein
MNGQNNLITLLLLTSVIVLLLHKRWFIAGLLLGLLIYKPQLVVGFLIVLLLRKKIWALVGFSLVTIALVGVVLLQHGFEPFIDYSRFMTRFVSNYQSMRIMEVSALSLLISATYSLSKNSINSIVLYSSILSSVLFAWVLSKPQTKSSPVIDYVLALLFPFITSPHLLFYDLLPLILVIILLANKVPSPNLIVVTAITYIFPVILLVLSKFFGISLIGIIPVYLCYLTIRNFVLSPKNNSPQFVLI